MQDCKTNPCSYMHVLLRAAHMPHVLQSIHLSIHFFIPQMDLVCIKLDVIFLRWAPEGLLFTFTVHTLEMYECLQRVSHT